MNDSDDMAWRILEGHFRDHSRVVNNFRNADAASVIAMWKRGANAEGESLSKFERDGLIERHCELLGSWPRQE